MRRITEAEVQRQAVGALGLDASGLDMTSVEGLAGALRRTASFLCPCSQAELVEEVARSLEDLVEDRQALVDTIDETVEALTAYGDLVESRMDTTDRSTGAITLLYLTPPTFVPRHDGSVFLLGIAPDNSSPLPADYAGRIEYDSHVRRVLPNPDESLRSLMSEFGLFELTMHQWMKSPAPEQAKPHVSRMAELLDAAPPAGTVADVRILDPSKPVRYYRGRWTPLRNHTGQFVARRPQAYGAELWCYIEVRGGQVLKLVDFPQFERRWRACDEAWRLQSAIDVCNGRPQNYRLRPGPTNETRVLDLFSPLPLWARRRWDVIGRPVPPSGSLFSYVLPAAAVEEEITFMKALLWLMDSREPG